MKGSSYVKVLSRVYNLKYVRDLLVPLVLSCFLLSLFQILQNQVILLIFLGGIFQLVEQKVSRKIKRNAPAKYSSLLFHEYCTNLKAGKQPHESFANWEDVDDEEVSKIFRSIALKIAGGHNIDLAVSEGFFQISDSHPELSYINQIYDSEKLVQSEIELLENRIRGVFRSTRSKSQIFIVFTSFILFIVPFSISLVLVLFQPNKSFMSAFVLLYPVFTQCVLSMLKPSEVDILS